MNVKKSLENLIRGWFPKEPTMITKSLQVNNEYKQPPQIIPPQYNASATKIAGGFAIFWILFLGLELVMSFNLEFHAIPPFQIMAWILSGLTIGIISNTTLTKNQLSRLSNDYQFTPNKKDQLILIIPIVSFSILGGFVNWFLYSSLQVFLISMLSYGVSFFLIRTLLFAAFERKQNMRLMQSWGGGGATIFLVPKAPNNNANHLESVDTRMLLSLTESG
jgi:hypothetical protein